MPRRRADEKVQQLWTALRTPAVSLAELAERLDWPASQVVRYLHYVRTRDPAQYGWTVPHVQRGSVGPDRRYFRVTYAAAGRGSADVDSASLHAAVRVGAHGTIAGVATTSESGAGALLGVVAHLTSPFQRRALRRIVRQMQFTAEQMRDLAADLQANGDSNAA